MQPANTAMAKYAGTFIIYFPRLCVGKYYANSVMECGRADRAREPTERPECLEFRGREDSTGHAGPSGVHDRTAPQVFRGLFTSILASCRVGSAERFNFNETSI